MEVLDDPKFLNLNPVATTSLYLIEQQGQATGQLLLTKNYLSIFSEVLQDLKTNYYLWIVFPCITNNFHSMADKLSFEKHIQLQKKVVAKRRNERFCPLNIRLIRVVKFENEAIHFQGVDIPNKTPVLDIIPFVNDFHNPSFLGNCFENIVPELPVYQVTSSPIENYEVNEITPTAPSLQNNLPGIILQPHQVPWINMLLNPNLINNSLLNRQEDISQVQEPDPLEILPQNLPDDENIFTLQNDNNTDFECDNVKNQQEIEGVINTFECEVCGKYYLKRTNLISHKRMHRRSYSCPICKRGFDVKLSLDLHLTRVTDFKRQCCMCNIILAETNDLHSHVKHCINLKTRRLHKCRLCNRNFANKVDLKNHIPLHEKEKPYSCEFCPNRFNHKASLRFHLESHDGPYKCNNCSRGFIKKNFLREHIIHLECTKKPVKRYRNLGFRINPTK